MPVSPTIRSEAVILSVPEMNLSCDMFCIELAVSVPPLRLIVPESYILRMSVTLTMPPVSMLSVAVPPCATEEPPMYRFVLSHVALLSETVVVALDPVYKARKPCTFDTVAPFCMLSVAFPKRPIFSDREFVHVALLTVVVLVDAASTPMLPVVFDTVAPFCM